MTTSPTSSSTFSKSMKDSTDKNSFRDRMDSIEKTMESLTNLIEDLSISQNPLDSLSNSTPSFTVENENNIEVQKLQEFSKIKSDDTLFSSFVSMDLNSSPSFDYESDALIKHAKVVSIRKSLIKTRKSKSLSCGNLREREESQNSQTTSTSSNNNGDTKSIIQSTISDQDHGKSENVSVEDENHQFEKSYFSETEESEAPPSPNEGYLSDLEPLSRPTLRQIRSGYFQGAKIPIHSENELRTPTSMTPTNSLKLVLSSEVSTPTAKSQIHTAKSISSMNSSKEGQSLGDRNQLLPPQRSFEFLKHTPQSNRESFGTESVVRGYLTDTRLMKEFLVKQNEQQQQHHHLSDKTFPSRSNSMVSYNSPSWDNDKTPLEKKNLQQEPSLSLRRKQKTIGKPMMHLTLAKDPNTNQISKKTTFVLKNNKVFDYFEQFEQPSNYSNNSNSSSPIRTTSNLNIKGEPSPSFILQTNTNVTAREKRGQRSPISPSSRYGIVMTNLDEERKKNEKKDLDINQSSEENKTLSSTSLSPGKLVRSARSEGSLDTFFKDEQNERKESLLNNLFPLPPSTTIIAEEKERNNTKSGNPVKSERNSIPNRSSSLDISGEGLFSARLKPLEFSNRPITEEDGETSQDSDYFGFSTNVTPSSPRSSPISNKIKKPFSTAFKTFGKKSKERKKFDLKITTTGGSSSSADGGGNKGDQCIESNLHQFQQQSGKNNSNNNQYEVQKIANPEELMKKYSLGLVENQPRVRSSTNDYESDKSLKDPQSPITPITMGGSFASSPYHQQKYYYQYNHSHPNQHQHQIRSPPLSNHSSSKQSQKRSSEFSSKDLIDTHSTIIPSATTAAANAAAAAAASVFNPILTSKPLL